MKGSIAAFQSIEKDLIGSTQKKQTIQEPEKGYLFSKKAVSLNNISFTYPGKSNPALKNINISIPAYSTVGIVGPSGSGKSTLINILLGLIQPQKGELTVDNEVINHKNLRSWQNTIGFVAQSIFLSEGTIAENVALGIPKDQINYEQVKKTLNLAHLTNLIEGLELGIHTKVGERGVKLSGGQQQRIGIARALYHKTEILVFDEATNSLDGLTEKIIMEAIEELGGQKTIVMIAHRLKTIEKCDMIFFIDKGQMVDHGTYQELIKSNKDFKKLASQS